MENTKTSFWQMVWDNNSSQIVVLNSEETEECMPYWLQVGEPMKCDSFSVILREENFDMDFAVRDFLLQSIDEDYEFTCRMITASYWPDSCTPIKSAFDLINKVKQFRLQMINSNISNTIASNYANFNTNQSPLIVHDLVGGHRAAVFCALFTFQDSIYLENSCNVYEIAKMYHLKRPNIWSHKSNIQTLYEAVESLFDEINSSNQHQFKTYLNMNIENHFNFMYSQSMSVANLASKAPPLVQSNTSTLPNLSSKIDDHQSEDAAGSKLHAVYKSESHDHVIKSPTKIAAKKPTKIEQNATKSILNDLPKILPFLNENKSSGSHFGTKKARKFMNTMMMKSTTFRKALFPLIMGNQKSESAKNDVVEVEAAHTDIKIKVEEVKKPEAPTSSEGTSSSAAGFSSSTLALSTTAITANESISSTSKAANPVSQNSSTCNLAKPNAAASKNTSVEKLNVSESCK
ncbi:tyrosine- phosphatase 99A-like [Brachionus plicatilis]|uniref:Tyrosine-phosphatase 99A-like n=1 Tax=Brachionus plicatilis TaxID=10195 RepID=A0A3M7QYW1_BRAPC|nr:tyrosine- phosphatase 99A-like [Brachionus plicatilis]